MVSAKDPIQVGQQSLIQPQRFYRMPGGLCKTPVITSLRCITWDVQKADDMPQQVIGNGFSSR